MAEPGASRRFLVGLVGSGVGPSLTPALHMRAAERMGIGYLYRTIDLDEHHLRPDQIGEILRMAEILGYDALNITHPCKTLVLPYLTEIDERARELGSVNTVVLRDGRRTGHNTDWNGFATSFERNLPGAPMNSVVLIGAGGAGMAVGHALLALGAGHLHVVDLQADRAGALAGRLSGLFPQARLTSGVPGSIARMADPVDGFVHCTPTGMAAHPGTPIDPTLLQSRHWVADIVYRPVRTQLLKAAEQAGCRTLNGAGMTVFQAVEAFTLITGRAPEPAPMVEHFHELVAAELS